MCGSQASVSGSACPFANFVGDHDDQRALLDQLSNFSIVDSDRIKSVLHSLMNQEHAHSYAENSVLPTLVTRYSSETEGKTINDRLVSDDVAITSAFETLDNLDSTKDFRSWQTQFNVLKKAINVHNAYEQETVFPLLSSKMSSQEKEKMIKDVATARQNVPSASITGAIIDGAKGLLGSVGSLFNRATSGVHQH